MIIQDIVKSFIQPREWIDVPLLAEVVDDLEDQFIWEIENRDGTHFHRSYVIWLSVFDESVCKARMKFR